jgi:DNA (cytosine-5)-methyltransferase 1
MRYFSTFSGIGGFELGIELAYESLDSRPTREKEQEVDTEQNSTNSSSKYSRQSPTCIGYSEIDKYAVQIYQKHFPEHKNYGDITAIIAEELPDFDLLVGGFPCPSFSIAGKRKGLDDFRGQLVFDVIRILRSKKPRMFLLENVKGLLSHDKGRTMEIICEELCESGYAIDFEVLNSKDFGVPQNRERVFVVGKRLDTLPSGAIY